jgi:hypothetical protein
VCCQPVEVNEPLFAGLGPLTAEYRKARPPTSASAEIIVIGQQ